MAVTGSTEQKIIFETGKRYLIDGNYSYNDKKPMEVTVLEISEFAYKLNFNRSDCTIYTEWKIKINFHDYYKILEELPPILNMDILDYNKPCDKCGGEGYILDDKSTVAYVY